MEQRKGFVKFLEEAKRDVSIVGSLSDFVYFAVVSADSVGRDRYSDWLRCVKSNSVR